jgi:hypothetical protein
LKGGEDMGKYKYLGTRKPTPEETKKGAEIIFIWWEEGREELININGATCYESWEQWGAIPELLSENIENIENWRSKQ